MFELNVYDLNGDFIGGKCRFDSYAEAKEYESEIDSRERPWNRAKEGEYTELPYGAVNYTEEDRIIEESKILQNPVLDEQGNIVEGQLQEVIIPAKIQHYYIVPKQYVVEIKDLTNDYEYKKQLVYAARKKEYGSLESQLDEQFHDYDKWKARIQLIKDKYPLPEKVG